MDTPKLSVNQPTAQCITRSTAKTPHNQNEAQSLNNQGTTKKLKGAHSLEAANRARKAKQVARAEAAAKRIAAKRANQELPPDPSGDANQDHDSPGTGAEPPVAPPDNPDPPYIEEWPHDSPPPPPPPAPTLPSLNSQDTDFNSDQVSQPSLHSGGRPQPRPYQQKEGVPLPTGDDTFLLNRNGGLDLRKVTATATAPSFQAQVHQRLTSQRANHASGPTTSPVAPRTPTPFIGDDANEEHVFGPPPHQYSRSPTLQSRSSSPNPVPVPRQESLPLSPPHPEESEEDSDDDYASKAAEEKARHNRRLARSYGRPVTPTMEEQDAQDLQEFEQEAIVSPERAGKIIEEEQVRGGSQQMEDFDAYGEGNEGDNEHLEDEHSEDEEEDSDDGVSYSPGPFPQQAIEELYDAHATYTNTINAIAKEYRKAPKLAWQVVGSKVKSIRSVSAWNAYQHYQRAKNPGKEWTDNELNEGYKAKLANAGYETLAACPKGKREEIFSDELEFYYEHRHEVMNHRKSSGKFPTDIKKAAQYCVRVCTNAWETLGVHIFGYIIDTQHGNNLKFGGSPVWPHIAENSRVVLDKQMKNLEHLIGVAEMSRTGESSHHPNGAVVSGSDHFLPDISPQPHEDKRDQARRLISELLRYDIALILESRNELDVTTFRKVFAKFPWTRWPDIAEQYEICLVNWDSKARSFPGANGFVVRDQDREVKAMVRARRKAIKADGIDLSRCVHIASWNEEDRVKRGRERANVAITIDTESNVRGQCWLSKKYRQDLSSNPKPPSRSHTQSRHRSKAHTRRRRHSSESDTEDSGSDSSTNNGHDHRRYHSSKPQRMINRRHDDPQESRGHSERRSPSPRPPTPQSRYPPPNWGIYDPHGPFVNVRDRTPSVEYDVPPPDQMFAHPDIARLSRDSQQDKRSMERSRTRNDFDQYNGHVDDGRPSKKRRVDDFDRGYTQNARSVSPLPNRRRSGESSRHHDSRNNTHDDNSTQAGRSRKHGHRRSYSPRCDWEG